MKQILLFLFFLVVFPTQSSYGSDWIRHRTPHYMILSQVSKEATYYIGRLMENVFQEYSKRFTFRKKVTGLFILKIFQNRENSQAYFKEVGGSSKWLGSYVRHKKELVVTFQKNRIALRSLLFHEGFHQFLEYYIPSSPVWFNEGLAEYFGYAIPYAPKKYRFGVPIIHHLKLLKLDMERQTLIPIGKLVGAPHQVFHNPTVEKSYYAQSWLLIHYLINNKKEAVNVIIRSLLKDGRVNYLQVFGSAKSMEWKLKKYLLRLFNKSGQRLFIIAQQVFKKGEYDQALVKFTSVLSKNKYHSQARHYRGLTHFQRRNYLAAIQDFSQNITIGHYWPAAFYYRGLSYSHLRKFKKALLDFQIAQSLDPRNRRIYNAIQDVKSKMR